MNKDILDRIDENTWIISDTHIGHGKEGTGILSFEPGRLTQMRVDGYKANEHDKWVIDNWNAKVKPGETVLHLGDFSFKAVADNIQKLNGNIILILGNHDGKGTEQKYQGVEAIKGFYFEDEVGLLNKIYNPIPNDRMLSGLIKEINGEKLLFCHYEIHTTDPWDYQNKRIAPRIEVLKNIFENHKCKYNIHGHTHSSPSSTNFSKNVSFEQIGFAPIRLGELLSK